MASINKFKGKFISPTEFVDENGSPMVLKKSIFPDNLTTVQGNSQEQKDSEKKKPNPNAVYVDARTGRRYKWNGNKFVEVK